MTNPFVVTVDVAVHTRDKAPQDDQPASAGTTPDPHRVRDAARILEEHGCEVSSVTTAGLAVSATPATFKSAFGVDIKWSWDEEAPSAGNQQDVGDTSSGWWTTDSDSIVGVPTSDAPLAGLVAKFLLVPPLADSIRSAGTLNATGSGSDVTIGDLLLGEIGQGLIHKDGLPLRVFKRELIPGNAGALVAAQRESLAGWAAIQQALLPYAGAENTKPKVEMRDNFFTNVDLAIRHLFPRATPFRATAVASSVWRDWQSYVSSTDHTTYRSKQHDLVVLMFFKSIDGYQPNPVLPFTSTFIDARRGLLEALGKPRPPSANLDAYRKHLKKLVDHEGATILTSGTKQQIKNSDDEFDILHSKEDLSETSWKPALERVALWLESAKREIRNTLNVRMAGRHGSMVYSIFQAVSQYSLPTTLINQERANYNIWYDHVPHEAMTANRNVLLSRSMNCILSDAAHATQVQSFRRAPSAEDRILFVNSVGNKNSRKDRPTDSRVLAGQSNVLFVGGCDLSPNEGRLEWSASPVTHGYISQTNPNRELPDLCAPTKGNFGASVVFPHTDEGHGGAHDIGSDQRYFTGSGSSQSAPIAAAVCGQVWKFFPELTAAEIKEAVIAGSIRFDAGQFHSPRRLSNQNTSYPVGGNKLLINLRSALIAADLMFRTSRGSAANRITQLLHRRIHNANAGQQQSTSTTSRLPQSNGPRQLPSSQQRRPIHPVQQPVSGQQRHPIHPRQFAPVQRNNGSNRAAPTRPVRPTPPPVGGAPRGGVRVLPPPPGN